MKELIKAILSGKPFISRAPSGEIIGWQDQLGNVPPTPTPQIIAALEVIKQRAECAMTWVDARTIEPELGKYYIVKTNGNEWRDFDLHLWPAPILAARLCEHIVRGKPMWVAEITEPRA